MFTYFCLEITAVFIQPVGFVTTLVTGEVCVFLAIWAWLACQASGSGNPHGTCCAEQALTVPVGLVTTLVTREVQ